MKDPLRLGILFSGEASTGCAILKAIQSGKLTGIKFAGAIASSRHAPGIAALRELDASCPIAVISPYRKLEEEFSEEIISFAGTRRFDLVGQYGWLPKTPSQAATELKRRGIQLINQHPGPLDPGRPDFGGRGMYGIRVHSAVLHFRRLSERSIVTEATAQYVHPEDYDLGAVLCRRAFVVEPNYTPEILKRLLLPIEHEVQIATLGLFVCGLATPLPRLEPLIRRKEIGLLEQAKAMALADYPPH